MEWLYRIFRGVRIGICIETAVIKTTLLFEDRIGLVLYAFCRNTILGAYNFDHLAGETFT